MNMLKKRLLKKLKKNKFALSDYIERKVTSKFFGQKTQHKLIELLPLIIENTSDSNCSWLISKKVFNAFLNDNNFLNIFIDNIDKFNFQNSNYILQLSIIKIQNFTNLNYQQALNLINNILTCNCKIDDNLIVYIHNLILNSYPTLEKTLFKKYIITEKSCEACIVYLIKKNIYLDLLYENIDFILENFKSIDLFLIKEKILELNSQELITKINNTIENNKKESIMTTVKNIYNKQLEDYEEYDYYETSNQVKVNINNEKTFITILEIVYLIIEDIAKNEQVSLSTMKIINSGGFSTALGLGDKIIKIGYERGTYTFPNNPYINAILLRKEFPINEKISFFIEVNEKVDTTSKIIEEELYQLYEKLRDINLIWNDISFTNVGRLLKDNKVYWREFLPITSELLGLKPYRGNEVLKKGDIVILDNDFIYDEYNLDKNVIHEYQNELEIKFEQRYNKTKRRTP